MANVKKQAKRARKQLKDFDLDAIKDRLPKDFDLSDLNLLRQREDEAASRGFLGGFLLGVLVGAVIALVFAPKRGEETREMVADAAGDIKEKASDLVHQVRGDEEPASASSAGAAVKDTAGDLKGNVQEALDNAGKPHEGSVSEAWTSQE